MSSALRGIVMQPPGSASAGARAEALGEVQVRREGLVFRQPSGTVDAEVAAEAASRKRSELQNDTAREARAKEEARRGLLARHNKEGLGGVKDYVGPADYQRALASVDVEGWTLYDVRRGARGEPPSLFARLGAFSAPLTGGIAAAGACLGCLVANLAGVSVAPDAIACISAVVGVIGGIGASVSGMEGSVGRLVAQREVVERAAALHAQRVADAARLPDVFARRFPFTERDVAAKEANIPALIYLYEAIAASEREPRDLEVLRTVAERAHDVFGDGHPNVALATLRLATRLPPANQRAILEQVVGGFASLDRGHPLVREAFEALSHAVHVCGDQSAEGQRFVATWEELRAQPLSADTSANGLAQSWDYQSLLNVYASGDVEGSRPVMPVVDRPRSTFPLGAKLSALPKWSPKPSIESLP